jgi:hypothetical protein
VAVKPLRYPLESSLLLQTHASCLARKHFGHSWRSILLNSSTLKLRPPLGKPTFFSELSVMQNKNGNYEKGLLIAASLIALAAVGYCIWDSQSISDRLALRAGMSKNNMNPPPTQQVAAVLQRLTEKVSWVSPVIGGKAVPLNKSIYLLQKGDQLFDLQSPKPVLREPMSNEFLLKYNIPNIESPNVGALDPDSDGFTNEEEFLASPQTNPMDPQSLPPVVQKLFLKSRITHDYKIKLNSSSPPFQVQRTAPEPKASKFVSPGDEFGFDRGIIRFKALSFEAKTVPDPKVGDKDVSELKCLDLSTKKEFVLIRGSETNLAEYEAEFEFRIGKSEVRKVKEGDTFQIPGIGVTYKVLSIEENQAVIVPVDGDKPSGAEITVKKG